MEQEDFTPDESDVRNDEDMDTQSPPPRKAVDGREDAPNPPVPDTAHERPARARGGRVGRLSQITADRPIFTLSVAADLLGLHPRTLRIYEEKKLVVPARTEGNRRRYSQNDIQRFQFIRRLTGSGVNLEGVRIILIMADEMARLGGDPGAVIERSIELLDTEPEEDDR